MQKMQRIIWWLQIPMIILLPVWLVVGRALLGSIGWLMLVLVFAVLPVVFVIMTAQTVLIFCRRDARENRRVSEYDAVWLTILYAATIVFGFFLVDFGDSEESVGSVASRLLGHGFVGTSVLLAVVFGVIAAVALIGGLVLAIIELVRFRRLKN